MNYLGEKVFFPYSFLPLYQYFITMFSYKKNILPGEKAVTWLEKKKEIDLTARKINRSKNRILSMNFTPVESVRVATGPSSSLGEFPLETNDKKKEKKSDRIPYFFTIEKIMI